MVSESRHSAYGSERRGRGVVSTNGGACGGCWTERATARATDEDLPRAADGRPTCLPRRVQIERDGRAALGSRQSERPTVSMCPRAKMCPILVLEPSSLFAQRARPTPLECENEYPVLPLGEETAVQEIVGSINWVFRRLKKPRYREISARGYALYSVRHQHSFSS